MDSLVKLNKDVFSWLTGIQSDPPPGLIYYEESPIWSRKYSSPSDVELEDESLALLEEVLTSVECDRMVVGHTPQKRGINSAGGGRIWRYDSIGFSIYIQS